MRSALRCHRGRRWCFWRRRRRRWNGRWSCRRFRRSRWDRRTGGSSGCRWRSGARSWRSWGRPTSWRSQWRGWCLRGTGNSRGSRSTGRCSRRGYCSRDRRDGRRRSLATSQRAVRGRISFTLDVTHALEVCGVVRLVELGVIALQRHRRICGGDDGVALACLLMLEILGHENFTSFSRPHARPRLQSHGIGIGGVNPQAFWYGRLSNINLILMQASEAILFGIAK